MKPKPDHISTRWLVGVYWLYDGEYGGMHEVASYEAALHKAAEIHRLGYNKPGIHEVRIVETRRKIWAVEQQ